MNNEKAIELLASARKEHNDECLLCALKDTRIDSVLALLAEPEKPKREQIIEDSPEESELPAILRDYSDTDDLIPKPVLEKVAERMEDLEGAINNILKHGPEKPCDRCGGSGIPKVTDIGCPVCGATPDCPPKAKPKDVAELREKLAELAHDQWSGWIKYMWCKSKLTVPGNLIIPAWAVDRWWRQANIKYEDLSKKEQESDRTEADKFIAIIENMEAEK